MSSKNEPVWPSPFETAKVQWLHLESLHSILVRDEDTLLCHLSGPFWNPAWADIVPIWLWVIAHAGLVVNAESNLPWNLLSSVNRVENHIWYLEFRQNWHSLSQHRERGMCCVNFNLCSMAPSETIWFSTIILNQPKESQARSVFVYFATVIWTTSDSSLSTWPPPSFRRLRPWSGALHLASRLFWCQSDLCSTISRVYLLCRKVRTYHIASSCCALHGVLVQLNESWKNYFWLPVLSSSNFSSVLGSGLIFCWRKAHWTAPLFPGRGNIAPIKRCTGMEPALTTCAFLRSVTGSQLQWKKAAWMCF